MSIYVNIHKKVANFQLAVQFQAENEIVALLGESGSGKSLTLKCIAGIETPDSGQIIVNQRVLFDSQKGINLPVRERQIGYLFQHYALFPNLTVKENIGISLPKKERPRRVSDLIASFKLSGLENSYPRTLSGGQQQRVALARMLARPPELLLLDEPFSALDEHLKWQLEEELVALLDSYQQTTLFVSHNRHEVYRLSQQIGVMTHGQLQPLAPKAAIFQGPRTKAAAQLTGCKNISAVEPLGHSRWFCKEWHCPLEIPQDYHQGPFDYVAIRAHDVLIQPAAAGPFVIQRIRDSLFDDCYVISSLTTGQGLIHVEQPKRIGRRFQVGETVDLDFPLESLMFLTD